MKLNQEEKEFFGTKLESLAKYLNKSNNVTFDEVVENEMSKINDLSITLLPTLDGAIIFLSRQGDEERSLEVRNFEHGEANVTNMGVSVESYVVSTIINQF